MKAVLLFIFLVGIWLLLTLNVTPPNIAVGVVSAFVVTLFFAKYSLKADKKEFHIQRYVWALIYGFVFLWECIKANVDVAYRVLHPALPVQPGIVRIKTKLKKDTALTFLANSITLTPGTMSVDIDREEGVLYIHWINVGATDVEGATRIIAHKFEQILKKVFE